MIRKSEQKGYALMEALLSVLLLSIGLLALMQAFQRSVQVAQYEKYYLAPAHNLAESLLNRYELGLLSDDRTAASDKDRPFLWEIKTSPWPHSPGLEQVSVTVTWKSGIKSGEVTITTLVPLNEKKTYKPSYLNNQ